jgi:hypothetical protein
MHQPLIDAGFRAVAAALLLALATGAGPASAQLGKPTYAAPSPTPPEPGRHADKKKDGYASDKPKPPRKDKHEELGIGGGTICAVDPDRCPDNGPPLRRNKALP